MIHRIFGAYKPHRGVMAVPLIGQHTVIENRTHMYYDQQCTELFQYQLGLHLVMQILLLAHMATVNYPGPSYPMGPLGPGPPSLRGPPTAHALCFHLVTVK